MWYRFCYKKGEAGSQMVLTDFEDYNMNPNVFMFESRNWGKLNYKKREPGSSILHSGISPFGFLFEKRILDKIKQ